AMHVRHLALEEVVVVRLDRTRRRGGRGDGGGYDGTCARRRAELAKRAMVKALDRRSRPCGLALPSPHRIRPYGGKSTVRVTRGNPGGGAHGKAPCGRGDKLVQSAPPRT